MSEPARALLSRSEITECVRLGVEPLSWVLAMWEGGSAAWGRADEWSDIDLQIVVDDRVEGAVAQTFQAAESALEAVSPIALRYAVPAPTWHGHAQTFYRLSRAGEFRIVDLAIMKRSAGDLFLEREKHGERIIFFDKEGSVGPRSQDPALEKARIATELEHLRASFPMFQSLIKKELVRGNALGAIAFYQSHTLQPLLRILRMRHCPERFRFGPRYSRADLPADVVAELEALWFVGDVAEIAKKRERAEALFRETLAAIDADGIRV